MIIDSSHRFIFVHVPRTGGHSIYSAYGKKSLGGTHIPRSQVPEDYFSFGFIRNPWARMYSCYCRQRQLSIFRGLSFRQYLDRVVIGNERIGRSAMYFLKGCDYIGKFEDLQSEWDTITSIIGLPQSRLPVTNAYTNGPYQEAYDDELAALIAKYHVDDIEYGGYTFEKPSAGVPELHDAAADRQQDD